MWKRRKMIPIETAFNMATLKFQTLISLCTFNFILFISLGTGSTYPQSIYNSSSTLGYNSHQISSRQLLQPSPSYYYRSIYRNRNYYNKLMSSAGSITTMSPGQGGDEYGTSGLSSEIHENQSFNRKKYHHQNYQTTPTYPNSKQELYNIYNSHYNSQQRLRKPTTTTTTPSPIQKYDHLTPRAGKSTTISSSSSESPIVFFPSAQTPEIFDTSASAYIRPTNNNNNNNNNFIDLGGGSTNNIIIGHHNNPSIFQKNKGQFPGSSGTYTISLQPPECNSDLGYCEEHDDRDGKLEYPKTIINSLLQKLPFTPSEFKEIYGETNDNSTQTTDLKLLERTGLGNNFDESPLCSSIEHTIYPRVARNKDNKWMYIVNHDEYIQGVRVEKCLDEGQPCIFSDTFSPPGFVTTCRQKFIYKKLLALSPEGRTQTDSFKLPSCCVCYVKRLGSGSSSGNGFTRIKSSPSDDSSLSTTMRPTSSSSTTVPTRSSGSGQMIFNDESSSSNNKPIITGTTTTSDL